MSTFSTDPRRFLGRPAKPCRKCGSVSHYVNRLGGISCQVCIPPREGYSLLGLTIVGGSWDNADDPFGVPDASPVDSKNSGFSKTANNGSGSSRVASNANQATSNRPDDENTVRRNAANEYADAELAWVVCRGGILDQMDAAAAVTPYQPATSRTGETADEKRERITEYRTGRHVTRDARPSNFGSVPAYLTEDMQFVAGSEIDSHGINQVRLKVYPAGENCLLFVGRKVPPRDPEAAAVEGSLRGMKDDAKLMAVIRLDGMLRIVDLKKVKAV